MNGTHRFAIEGNKGLLLAALFVCLTLGATAQSVDSLPKPTDYVSDDAHVLRLMQFYQLDSLCSAGSLQQPTREICH